MNRKWSLLAVLLVGASCLTGCVVDVESESDDFAFEDDTEAFEQNAPADQVVDMSQHIDEQQAAEHVFALGDDDVEEPVATREMVMSGSGDGSNVQPTAFTVNSKGGGGREPEEGPDPQPWYININLNVGPDSQPWELPAKSNTDQKLGPDPQPW